MLKISAFNNNDTRGIFFYDELIYYDLENILELKDYGVRSYKFVLSLVYKEKEIEVITFIDTLNLKDLPVNSYINEIKQEVYLVDWEKYLLNKHKELYNYHLKRAKKKLTNSLTLNKDTIDKLLAGNNETIIFQEFKKALVKLEKLEYFKLPYYEITIEINNNNYVKYFITIEEVKEELAYLKLMQPLNLKIDLKTRDYYNEDYLLHLYLPTFSSSLPPV